MILLLLFLPCQQVTMMHPVKKSNMHDISKAGRSRMKHDASKPASKQTSRRHDQQPSKQANFELLLWLVGSYQLVASLFLDKQVLATSSYYTAIASISYHLLPIILILG